MMGNRALRSTALIVMLVGAFGLAACRPSETEAPATEDPGGGMGNPRGRALGEIHELGGDARFVVYRVETPGAPIDGEPIAADLIEHTADAYTIEFDRLDVSDVEDCYAVVGDDAAVTERSDFCCGPGANTDLEDCPVVPTEPKNSDEGSAEEPAAPAEPVETPEGEPTAEPGG